MSETPRTAEQLAIELSNRAFDCGGNDSSASQSRIARREAALNKAEKDVIERITTLERELADMTAERDVYKFACKHAYQRERLAERQVAVLADFVQAFLDTVDEPPDPNCSCCISPPCADCVENSGLRRLFVQAKKIREQAVKEGGKG